MLCSLEHKQAASGSVDLVLSLVVQSVEASSGANIRLTFTLYSTPPVASVLAKQAVSRVGGDCYPRLKVARRLVFEGGMESEV